MNLDEGIREVVRSWQEAWNSGDMPAAGRLFCEDADFVNVRGTRWHTRAEIETEHGQRHRRQLRDSVFTPVEVSQQRIGADIALVHLRWTISGDHDLDNTSRAPRNGLMSWLMLRDVEGRWRIRSAHNTHITAET
jgi:uncharacterized protein (TIGR02246 family)